ncbi:terminase large subunit domain-containing protein [Curtobacterium sp. MCBD17_008]|uniref:terminase large subunit domain-containing protein n=1 Tax=Curtobacterium sp. MCBD17_008 TaxID=2175656 RepID=UPI0011B44DCA|nr:terminase family protein [Curtobacterium sp. MCBD17_008]
MPRLWTKPLRPLTPETSLGFEVIEFADWARDRLEELDANRTPEDDVDYLALMPRLLDWQRWLLIHALELLDVAGSVPRFRTVLLLVARQNGKSTLLTVLILWRLFQDGARMVLETHATIDHAREAWDEAVAVAEAIPELADEIDTKHEGKGSVLLMLDRGEKFKIASANRNGGRGFRGDFVIFDELRQHQDFRAWAATSKTTLARRRAQVWGVSNAGDAASVVLRHLRTVALAAINGEAPEGVPEDMLDDLDLGSIGLFEWSAGDVDGVPRGRWDRDGWAEANPSMGHTELDERAIAAAALSDPEVEFRTEVLCQFVNTAGTGPFPTGAWQATTIATVERDIARPVAFCIDVSHDRVWAHIAIAFWDTEGRRRVEIAASRPGTDWVIPWLTSKDRAVRPEHLTLQWNGAPVSSLVTDLENVVDAPWGAVTPWQGPDLARASGIVFDAVSAAVVPADDVGLREPVLTLTHGAQPNLDLAATTAAVRPAADGWLIDRQKSPQDASPLVAAVGAVWLLNTNPEPTGSAYDDEGAGVLVL